MAHDILGSQFAATQSAWHRIGIVDATLTRAIDAVNAGGMNWNIHKLPLTAVTPDGSMIDVPLFGLIREPVAADPVWATLGTCGGDYDYWQNADVADRVDMLSDATGWKFSTAGIIGNGATIFICLEADEYTVKGDPVKRFFVYKETRDGKTRSAAIMSDVRVVCQNTLDLATKTASGLIKIKHHSDYKSMADWSMSIVSEAHKAGQTVSTAMNQLAEIMVTDEMFSDMLGSVAPMPTMPAIMSMRNLTGTMKEKADRAEYVYAQKCNTANKVRNQLVMNYGEASDIPSDLRGTGWHAYQAVTAYTSHQHGTLGARGSKMGAVSRAAWDLSDGTTMRNAAYEFLSNGAELFD